MKYIDLEDTVVFHFGLNDTNGNGIDGTSGTFDVRDTSAAIGATPVFSGTAELISEATFPNGCYQCSIPATALNGFAADKEYAVFVTITAGIITPTAHVGDFATNPIKASLGLVDGKTVEEALAIIGAGVAGNLSGVGSGIETFVGLDGVTTRMISTVDPEGNRSVTYPVVVMVMATTPPPPPPLELPPGELRTD